MPALDAVLQNMIHGWVANVPNATLALAQKTFGGSFSDTEMKRAIEQLITDKKITAEGDLLVIGGQITPVVKLRPRQS